MTLTEAIKAHEGEFLYIGSSNSFFYIGGGVISETLSALRVMDEYYTRNDRKTLINMIDSQHTLPKRQVFLEGRIKNLTEEIEGLNAQIEELKESKTPGSKEKREGLKAKVFELEKSLKKASRELERNAYTIKTLPKRIEDLKAKLARRTPLATREVTEIYDRKWIEPLGKIICVKGRENGIAWDQDEFLKEYPPIAEEFASVLADTNI